MKKAVVIAAVLLSASPAFAQLGKLGQLTKQAEKLADLNISEQEERDLGERVSATVRTEFGVLQDAAVTRYVALVGNVLAKSSSRPGLKWEFIVLDTDGVNAFAAPGGLVHITKGALGLIRSEAELAGVLGHEIAHVTSSSADSIVATSATPTRRACASPTRPATTRPVSSRSSRS
jgi:predicted Zn-dependent protease